MFSLIVVIHVLAVLAALAVLASYPLMLRQATSGGDRASVHERMLRLLQRVLSPAMVVIILAGLTAHHDGDFGAFYVAWGFIAIFVIGGVTGSVLTPGERKLAALAAEGGPEYDTAQQRQVRFVLGLAALVIVTMVLMSLQLGH